MLLSDKNQKTNVSECEGKGSDSGRWPKILASCEEVDMELD